MVSAQRLRPPQRSYPPYVGQHELALSWLGQLG